MPRALNFTFRWENQQTYKGILKVPLPLNYLNSTFTEDLQEGLNCLALFKLLHSMKIFTDDDDDDDYYYDCNTVEGIRTGDYFAILM